MKGVVGSTEALNQEMNENEGMHFKLHPSATVFVKFTLDLHQH